MDYFYIFLAILFSFFVWFLIGKILKNKEISKNRKDAVVKSRSIILWELYEKISPLLQDFPYSPKDLIFVWKGIDYVVLNWLSNWDLTEIVFLEIKSWKSALNKNEKDIKNIINTKKIRYEEIRY